MGVQTLEASADRSHLRRRLHQRGSLRRGAAVSPRLLKWRQCRSERERARPAPGACIHAGACVVPGRLSRSGSWQRMRRSSWRATHAAGRKQAARLPTIRISFPLHASVPRVGAPLINPRVSASEQARQLDGVSAAGCRVDRWAAGSVASTGLNGRCCSVRRRCWRAWRLR